MEARSAGQDELHLVEESPFRSESPSQDGSAFLNPAMSILPSVPGAGTWKTSK